MYSYILKRYLEHKYKNLNKAAKKLSTLMNLTSLMDLYMENSKIIFDEVNITSFDNLLMELWGFSNWQLYYLL